MACQSSALSLRGFATYTASAGSERESKLSRQFRQNLCTSSLYRGLQLSWLERTPDKREVDGSSPFKPTEHKRVQSLYLENRILKFKLNQISFADNEESSRACTDI